MKYDVVIKRKVAKGLRKLPVWVQKKMAVLAEDLREKGPEQLVWQNSVRPNTIATWERLGLLAGGIRAGQ